jgi:hypothetical protein
MVLNADGIGVSLARFSTLFVKGYTTSSVSLVIPSFPPFKTQPRTHLKLSAAHLYARGEKTMTEKTTMINMSKTYSSFGATPQDSLRSALASLTEIQNAGTVVHEMQIGTRFNIVPKSVEVHW